MKPFYIIMFSLLCVTIKAQTNDFSFRIYYQTTSSDTAVFDSLCNRICEVSLGDTTGIAAIEVSVGTTEGGTDVLQYAFVFDATQNLPVGLVYFRSGSTVKLILLQTTQSDMYYYAVRLQYTNGQYSQTRIYN